MGFQRADRSGRLLRQNGDFAIETVVLKNQINRLIPALSEAGATDLIEIPIAKIVP